MSSAEVKFDTESWWLEWHSATDHADVDIANCDDDDVDPSATVEKSLDRLGRFHQECVFRFYDETISKQKFFQVCCLFWMEQFLSGAVAGETPSGPTSPKELFEALRTTYTGIVNQQPSDISVIRWIMPSRSAMGIVNDVQIASKIDSRKEDAHYLSMSMKFWDQLFEAQNKEFSNGVDSAASVANDENHQPNKRRRLLSHYVERFSTSGSLSNGKHNLPAATLLLSVMKQRCETWDQLYEWSKQLPQAFPTFSSNVVQSALSLVGLHSICQQTAVEGLSIFGLFSSYFVPDSSTICLSVLQTLQEALGLDLYHLRAALCRQLFDAVFVWESTSMRQRDEALEACTSCMCSENPISFLSKLEGGNHKRIRTTSVTPSIPDEVASPAFPILVHLKLWLLTPKADEAAELVRRMDSSSKLSLDVKEEGRLCVWRYLLQEGELFLDGHIETDGYEKRQTFLYEQMAFGVSDAAIDTMINFYQNIADFVYEQTNATPEERQYVVLACQQTLLRLFLQVYGLGDKTVLMFIKRTKWPIELSSQGATRNLSHWCIIFLEKVMDVPPSLLKEDTDEVRFEEAEQESSKDEVAEETEKMLSLTNPNTRKPVRRILDLNGRFGILHPMSTEKSIEVTFEKEDTDASALAAENVGHEEDGQGVVNKSQQTSNGRSMDESQQENETLDVEDITNELLAPHYHEDAIEADEDPNVDAMGPPMQEDVPQEEEEEDDEEPYEEESVYEQEEGHAEIEIIESNDEEGNERQASEDEQEQAYEEIEFLESDEQEDGNVETSEEDLPASRFEHSYNRESDEDDRQFYEREEAESYEDSSDAGDGGELDADEEEHESENEQMEHRVEGGQTEDDAIVLDSDSSNEDGDDSDNNDEAESVRGETPKEDAVEEDVEGDRGTAFLDDGNDETEQDESDNSADGEDDFEEMDDGNLDEIDPAVRKKDNEIAEDDEEEYADSMVADSHQEEMIAVNRDDDEDSHGIVIGTTREDRQNEGDETTRPTEHEQEMIAEPEAVSAMASHYEAYPEGKVPHPRNDAKSPATQSVSSGKYTETPEHEMESAADGQKDSRNMESDATDDEKEGTLPVEKAETDDAAVGGEFGDTTDEEEEDNENMRANRAAEANRRADVTQEGYNSQIGDGYDPEDTHGYTEEDASEAIHTEDEEDDRRQSMNVGLSEVEKAPHDVVPLAVVDQNVPHSSDDMDMADEHTEQEDLGAESSELEDAVEGTVAPTPMAPPMPSTQPKDATTLVEFAQTAQHQHDWKQKSKEDRTTPEAKPLTSVDTDKDETCDADDEKDATEASRNIETEEELAPHEEQVGDAEVHQKEGPLNDEESLEDLDELAGAVETWIEMPSNGHVEDNEMSVVQLPSVGGGEDIGVGAEEDAVDDVETDEADEVDMPTKAHEETVHCVGDDEEPEVGRSDSAELFAAEPEQIATQSEPQDAGTETAMEVIDQDTSARPASESKDENENLGAEEEEEENAEDSANPKETIEEQAGEQQVEDRESADPTSADDVIVDKDGTGDAPLESALLGAEEEGEEGTKETTEWKKGDVVMSSNPRYWQQSESAKIMKVNIDESGYVTYDLQFLTSKDKAKNVAPSNIFPCDDEDGGDDISSIEMNDLVSRQNEATSTLGTPRRTQRRTKSAAGSPGVPRKIDTRSTQQTQEALAASDVAGHVSTPSRSGRATRSTTTSCAYRAELPPIAETPTKTKKGRPSRPKKDMVATTQAAISASYKSEKSVPPTRRSSRARKRSKKFDDEPNDTAVESRDEDPSPGIGVETEMKKPSAKKSAAKAKNMTNMEETEAPAQLTRSATRSRAKKDDDESAISESASVARGTRSRTKQSNDDDQSVASRMSTRSTRSSTRRAKQ